MKHIIIIETSDCLPVEEEDKQKFQQMCYETVECIAEHFHGECFVRSAFYEKSAIAATHEMYNAPKWEGGI